jgi:hypothetical protein
MNKRKKSVWLEEYRCGCSAEAAKKSDLLGYCKNHGESRRFVCRIPIEVKP